MPPIVRTPPDISDPNATTTKSSVALGRWWDSTGSSPNGTSDLSYTWETTDAELLLNSTTYETPTEIIESRTSEKPQHEFNLSKTIVALSFLIGCFALVALALRIGSRLKKAKLEAKERKRHQKMTNKVKSQPTPQTHKRLTIRMHVGQDSVKTGSSKKKPEKSEESKRKNELTLSPLAFNIPESVSNQKSQDRPKTERKRSRTLEALIEIGAFPPDYTLRSSLDQTPETPNGQYDGSIVEPSTSDNFHQGKRENRVKLNLSTNGASYTNKAFDLSNPDEIQSAFPNRKEYTKFESHFPISEAVSRREEGRSNGYSQLKEEGASSSLTSDKEDRDLSEGSSNTGKEADKMLDRDQYTTSSSSESDDSPLSARRYFQVNYMKHYEKNRNNSRDSGYVESVTSQDSIKKRKLGIVEPFSRGNFLEKQFTPHFFTHSEDNFISHCPTCHSLAHQNQSLHPPQVLGIIPKGADSVPFKMSPCHKDVSYRSPYHHLPLGQSSSYALGHYRKPHMSYPRSYSVVGENADYNLKCAILPTHRFVKKLNSETQTDGTPLHRKSTVRWKKEGANFILTPMEDNEIDHLGPIYLASEIC